MTKLTTHQLNVAVFIHAYQAMNDNMPTNSEIAAAFGITSNAAYECFKRLTKYGVLEPSENPCRHRFARTSTGAAFMLQIIARRRSQGAHV